MSIQNAMQAGVAGLKANAAAVGRISENIANSNTIGYKRSFTNMVTSVAGESKSVNAVSRSDMATAGSLVQSSSSTDMAIEGEGYFVVMKDPESDDASNFMLTRAGSFDEDENGYLVNDAGYYLAGFVYDDEGSLGGVDRNSFTMMEAINTNGVTMTAQASSEASISGNLPSSMTATGTPQDPFISSMSYYTPLGEQQIMSFAWTPSDTVANQWSVEISDENGTTYGTVVVDFSDSGATAGSPLSYSGTPDAGLTAPAAFSVDANGNISLVIDNGATPQTLEIALGTPGSYDGITQFDGDYEPQTMIVDGSSTAALESTEVDENGNFVGVFANGERVSMYQIPVATVDNPEGMVAVSGNAWQLSLTSGSAVMNVSGGNAGTILTGVTEASNVELAEEMTSLIQVQRAYSSNTTIITTSDEMLQEVNNLKR